MQKWMVTKIELLGWMLQRLYELTTEFLVVDPWAQMSGPLLEMMLLVLRDGEKKEQTNK
jgi:hypothetical protein